MELRHKAATLLAEGLKARLYSGAAAFFASRERFWAALGTTSFAKDARPVDETTPFDLASLTKPLCTAVLTLWLVQRGLVRLEDSVRRLVSKALPDRPWGEATVEDLLRHTAGFAAWAPLFDDLPQDAEPRTWYFQNLLSSPQLVEYKPQRKRIYSDLGYILLGLILERLSGERLDSLFETMLAELALETDLHFNPLEDSGVKRRFDSQKYAATKLNETVLQGIVHDQNCAALGGIAGHAGLFGSVSGVAKLIEFLQAVLDGEANGLRRDLLEYAVTVRTATTGEQYALGFDTPTGDQTTAGAGHPQDCIGHLGFTGTSFWWSPRQKRFSVLLTNRVYTEATKEEINRVRRAVHSLGWTD